MRNDAKEIISLLIIAKKMQFRMVIWHFARQHLLLIMEKIFRLKPDQLGPLLRHKIAMAAAKEICCPASSSAPWPNRRGRRLRRQREAAAPLDLPDRGDAVPSGSTLPGEHGPPGPPSIGCRGCTGRLAARHTRDGQAPGPGRAPGGVQGRRPWSGRNSGGAEGPSRESGDHTAAGASLFVGRIHVRIIARENIGQCVWLPILPLK